MKKLIKFFFVFLFFFVGFYLFKNNYKAKDNPEDQRVLGLPSEEKKNTLPISLEGVNLNVSWIEVADEQSLTLYPNYTERLTSMEAVEKYGCSALTSAGFYSTQNSPIGLFITDRKTLNKTVSSTTLNGFYSLNDFYTPRITRDLPKDSLRTALQSGPLLKENGQTLPLRMKNDFEERRMAVGVTGENKTYFLVFYDPLSVFLGLKMVDLGKAIALFEKESGIVFADVLNLDGGTASVFYIDNLYLPEVSMSGSFFCLK